VRGEADFLGFAVDAETEVNSFHGRSPRTR
jgi:hypothetical protein